jgi:putative sugar O-methyltransferase
MIKVAYDKSAFDPMLRWLFKRKSSRYYKQITTHTYAALVHWGHELLRDQIEHYDITSPDIYGVDCVDLGSRKLSYTTLQKLGVFLTLKNAASSPTRIILEIGSGVGELARIFLTTKTCEKYIIIDIPPALAFAQRLLSETFGDDKMSFWSKDRKQIDLSDKNICYFLTPDQIDVVPKFDLGINQGSFGEMTTDIVQSYIQALIKKKFSEFFSINQRLKKSNSLEIIGEKQYIEYFSPDYQCIRKALYSPGKPFRDFEEDKPGEQGYQWLHFHKAELKAKTP